MLSAYDIPMRITTFNKVLFFLFFVHTSVCRCFSTLNLTSPTAFLFDQQHLDATDGELKLVLILEDKTNECEH